MLAMMQGGFRTREDRMRVSLPCRLNSDGQWAAARIHNASSRGLLLASEHAPAPGAYVEVRLDTRVLVGRVVWRKDRFVGIRLQDRLDVKALLAEPRRPGTAPVAPERPAASPLVAERRPARTAEQNRHLSTLFQYAVVVAIVAAAAGLVGSEVYHGLGRPAALIEDAVAGITH